MKAAGSLLLLHQQLMMISAPSYYLHLSFLLHGMAFVLLVVGYSTPYWTVVSVSSGRVHYLGLVVSCWESHCEMLHLTEARELMVVVFSVCTANIILALFIAQLFCLSICNASFRLRNMGIGLSYLSFLMALSVGVSQILYQIDLKEEHKQDVSTMKLGWSRHLVITSCLAFFLGALFSIIDYNKRTRLHQREIQRRCSVNNKIVDTVHEREETHQDITESVNDTCVQEKKLLKAVQNMATIKAGLSKSVKNHCTNTAINNTVPILVASGNNGITSVHGQSHQRRDAQLTRFQDREGIAIVADALKKYNLTKVRKSELIDGRHCLPTVEEEGKMSIETLQTGHRVQKKGVLTRQEAVADESGSSSDESEKLCETNSSNRERQHDDTDNLQNNTSTREPSCDQENEKKDNRSQSHLYRRSSTVGTALLNVSQFLGKTVSGGHLITDYSFGENNSKPSFQNNASSNPEKKPTCNPIGKWRKTFSQNSKRSDESFCPSVDSQNTDLPGKSTVAHDDDNETVNRPKVEVAGGSHRTNRRGSKFHEKLSSDQIKRNMILECLSRDLGKRRKQIRQ